MLNSPKNRCHVTPLPPHNGQLSTTASSFCPHGGRYGEVRPYLHPRPQFWIRVEGRILINDTLTSNWCLSFMEYYNWPYNNRLQWAAANWMIHPTSPSWDRVPMQAGLCGSWCLKYSPEFRSINDGGQRTIHSRSWSNMCKLNPLKMVAVGIPI